MTNLDKRHRFVHWVAIIALLMSALGPSISQAFTAHTAENNPMGVVCSSSGVKTVQSADDLVNQHGSDQNKAIDGHCAYCVLQGHYYLPTDQIVDPNTPKPISHYPELYYQSPKLLFAWIKSPSQAPPNSL